MSGRLDSWLKNRTVLFWTLHVGGWLGYALSQYLGTLLYENKYERMVGYTTVILVAAVSGFLLSPCGLLSLLDPLGVRLDLVCVLRVGREVAGHRSSFRWVSVSGRVGHLQSASDGRHPDLRGPLLRRAVKNLLAPSRWAPRRMTSSL